MNSILAKKVEQGQKFLENGKRIPVTKLDVEGNVVVAIKTQARDHYSAVQLGFDKRVKARPAKSNKSAYQFLREVRMADADVLPSIGDAIKASSVFKPGDVVNVTGISKGKGFAGGVKRHHFKGGPRTHGQSDRERAPGAIGSTTTPGRVYRGKRMAGHMGHEQVMVKNLQVVFVDDNTILVKGLVPGPRNNLLMLEMSNIKRKFTPLYADKPIEPTSAEASTDAKAMVDKVGELKEVKVEAKVEEKKEEVKANAS